MPHGHRRDRRVGLEVRLRPWLGSVDELLEREVPDGSRAGVLARTLEPRPPGTERTRDVAAGDPDVDALAARPSGARA